MSEDSAQGFDVACRLYAVMSMIRAFETAAERLQASGIMDSSLHLSIGQEAVAAGVCDVLRRRDLIATTHRGHGHCIAKGGALAPMMGELFARAGGYCGGKSGSMHIADPASGILGANAIVGAGIPIALGAALTFQQEGRDEVAVAFFGEGAVAEGVFHESLNIAALWKLPVIFVCENNGYAEMTPVSVHLAGAGVAAFGAPYGIAASTVDGNDVLEVRNAAQAAAARARSGGGPVLLEARTYRWRGHYQGDPQTYRSREEIEQWRERDPLQRLRSAFPAQAGRFDTLDQQAGQAVSEAVDEARSWPEVPGSALTEHVYAPSA